MELGSPLGWHGTVVYDFYEKLKISQEKYANAFSKNQSIKNDLIKREERINNIDIENDKWKSLKSNSEKMSFELEKRNEEIKNELEDLNKLPQDIAIKKGQSMQNISTTEKEKDDLLKELEGAEKEYENLNVNLKSTQEKMIIAREKRARSKATYEGLQNRKTDLLNTIKNDLNIGEDKLLEYSYLNEVKELLNSGLSSNRLNYFGLEYKYVGLYLDDKLTLDELNHKLYLVFFLMC